MTRLERVREIVRQARAVKLARLAMLLDPDRALTRQAVQDYDKACHQLVEHILHLETQAAIAPCGGPFLPEADGSTGEVP